MDIERKLLNYLELWENGLLPDCAVVYDKWLLSSALQKSIRRGLLDTALTMASQLLRLDADYIWRRLPVIALEDVGVGNIELCNQILFASGKKAWRAKYGGDAKILSYFIHGLCNTAKCRNGDCLPYIADFTAELAQERWEYPYLSRNQLADTIKSDANLYNRLLAGWVLCGTKLIPAENINSSYNELELFLEILHELGFDEGAVFCIDKGFKKTRCFLPLGMAFAKIEADKHEAHVAENNIDTEFVGSIPLCALDKHTRLGKRAINRFATKLPQLSQMLPNHSYDDIIAILGKAIFYIESALVNKELVYPSLKQIKQDYVVANIGRFGLDEQQVYEVLELVDKNTHLLNRTRAALLQPNS